MSKKYDFVTIKVHVSTRAKIESLVNTIREEGVKRGWEALGSERSELPTVTAVVDEAVEQLSKRRAP